MTEFNYVWPNPRRAEGGVLMSAYAGLQDWDALYTFDYAAAAADAFTPGVVTKGGRIFSLVTDPIGLLADRAGAFLFLHGGVKPGKGAVAYLVDQENSFAGVAGDPDKFPKNFAWPLGLITRVGSLTAEGGKIEETANRTGIRAFVTPLQPKAGMKPSLPVYPQGDDLVSRLEADHLVPAGSAKSQIYTSDTGQIELNRRACAVKLVAPCGEGFVLPASCKLEGETAAVDNGATEAAVYVLSADRQPLKTSSRLVVLHLTDSLNTGSSFTNQSRGVMSAFGTLPHLVRNGSARVTLKLAGAVEEWKAWAIDASGHRLHPVALGRNAGGALILEANTAGSDGAVLAYEIVRG